MTETLRSLYTRAFRSLREADCATPALDARLLISNAFGISPESWLLRQDAAIDPKELAKTEKFIKRRADGEPVSRILGRRAFWTLDMEISPCVLDPRPDSEAVILAALKCIENRPGPLSVLDLGTGSGCLLLAVLNERTDTNGIGIDRSEKALEIARRNAQKHGLADRATFILGNWTDGIEDTFDLILSNPPYIPTDDIANLDREVRDHDPCGALDGGPDGLDAYRSLAPRIARHLKSPGCAVLETGAGQLDDVRNIFVASDLCIIHVEKDLSGTGRAIIISHESPVTGKIGSISFPRA
ncbi:MAG: peptide chain release factor N(5)-glutamine methyltransferase [Pseudomonadota bacterium]|nr:peptide chain release factor N(5)-glutamine methyltransferase [Pseudomonadota bacterium]